MTARHFTLAALLGAGLLPGSLAAQYGATDGEWRFYGGDGGHTQYTALDQIDASNVGDLEVAWRWTAESAEDRPFYNLEATPIMVGGVLYTTTGASEVAAIDAATGQTLWLFTPSAEPVPDGERARPLTGSGRGVAYWRDGDVERLFHNVSDGRLLALDARTGEPASDFGQAGFIDLAIGNGEPGARLRGISTPIVSNGVVVSQGLPVGEGNGLYRATPGSHSRLRREDRRTPVDVPCRAPGERIRCRHLARGFLGIHGAHAGVWTQLTVDEELGYVYLPTESATNDWYGGHRPGDNLFAESIVALDIRTGERVWHYQLIHHGIWDYDVPAPPTLLDVTHEGRRVRAVAVVTKQGFTYVFDRVTGEPLWPIIEMPVPQSDIPGEQTSLTQPIPSRPAPFERQGFTVDDLLDLTPELREEAMELAAKLPHGAALLPAVTGQCLGRNEWPAHASWLGRRSELARSGRRHRGGHPLHSLSDGAHRHRPRGK